MDESFFRSRKWTIQAIKSLKIKDISPEFQSFNAFLTHEFPNPSEKASTTVKDLYAKMGPGGTLQQQKVKAFVNKLFPPLVVGKEGISNVAVGDIHPQFTVEFLKKRILFFQ